jgi:hypothetical protein
VLCHISFTLSLGFEGFHATHLIKIANAREGAIALKAGELIANLSGSGPNKLAIVAIDSRRRLLMPQDLPNSPKGSVISTVHVFVVLRVPSVSVRFDQVRLIPTSSASWAEENGLKQGPQTMAQE